MTKVEMLILTALLANLAVMVINLARDLMIWVKKNRRERSINRKNEQLEKIKELTNQMCFERKTNKELIEKCQELLESKNELVKKLRESTTNSKLKLCPQCGGEVALLYDACVNGYYIVPKEKNNCGYCKSFGTVCDDREEVIKLWNSLGDLWIKTEKGV